MDNFSKQDVTTGYNDLQQAQVSIQSAQKMIGTATMSMSPQQLSEATEALANARTELEAAHANATGVDEEFLQKCMADLKACEQQLTEAKQ
ncbi:DUF2564 family protein [Priestia flexa]|uniref:DUF2564 family protein n=1 Tax=Priestia flexa TaxID=86664 RepID=A0ABU4J232_9BACI|nr:DUF2564 family protein [Priestia flexa]MDW8515042.1 DUF2564 family protein [Priestia flexa]